MSEVAAKFQTKISGHNLIGDLNFGFKAGRLNGASKLQMTTVPELWLRSIGYQIDQRLWEKSEQESNQLKSQSEMIARRLDSQGIPSKADTKAAVIGICTGVVETVKQYRNTNIIPVMQSKNVHGISRHVKYFADNTNKKHLRMFVISNGWVKLEDYREAHKKFTRTISRYAAHENVKDHGVELCYYNIENTIKRNDKGEVELNMHSHVLVKSTKRLGPQKWENFMKWSRGQFSKGYMHDEKIRNIQECVKYVFKPAEFNQLSDPELAALFHQTFRLKFFHPLGEIRAFRKELEDNKMKLVKLPPKTPIDAATEMEEEWQWHIIEKAKAGTRARSDESSGDAENVLMAITNPSPKFSNQFEPCLVVHNFDGDVQGLIDREGIGKLVKLAKQIWARRTAASMKHTTTTTVRASRKKTPQKSPIIQQGEIFRKIPPIDHQNRQENQIWQ